MNIPVIAITGSVGKTSTREMISSVFSKEYNILTTYKNYNGYIGLSLMLLKLDNQELAILELGIDWVGEMDKLADAARPTVAIITMIGTSHIGIFESQSKIFEEKLKIAKYMNESCSLILNGDDNYLNEYNNNKINLIRYSINDVFNIEINESITKFTTKIYDIENEISLHQIGKHNIYNTLACIKVAELYNIQTDNIVEGLEEYKNLSRRFEKNLLKNNIQIIDDTYNASIDSMKAGIKAIEVMKAKRKIIILGDMFELGDFTNSLHVEVGKLFEDSRVDILLTLGENAKIIANEAKKYIDDVYEYTQKEELIKDLCKLIKEGDLIYFKASNAMKFDEIIKEVIKYNTNE
jgi:UDP-N-acetylmuramoyl-tripeptide--D-alanyl-D-alanine ligase